MSEVSQRQTMTRIGPLQMGIIVLTVATALIHLSRGLAIGAPSLRPFPLLFYLNFIGYLVLLIALYVPQLLNMRRTIRWTLIIYTALTIVLWMVFTRFHSVFIGYVDKPIEIALIILLLIEDRQARLTRT